MNPEPEMVLSTASYLEQYGWYLVICAIGLYVVWNKFQCSIKSTPSECCPPNGETQFQFMDPKMKDVLFFAGRCLPDEDKIKLIDIVPGIANYVKTLILNTDQDEDVMCFNALVKRLPNLRKVIAKTPLPSCPDKRRRHREVLQKLAQVNPRITVFKGFYYVAILDYIECVKEQYPNYDAGNIRKKFSWDPDLKRFLRKLPDMKLKLKVNVRNGSPIEVDLWNAPLLSDRAFKLVRKVMVQSNVGPILSLLPNVDDVTIFGSEVARDLSIIRSVFEVKNLRRLCLSSDMGWTEANYIEFQSILMNPSLKHLRLVLIEIPNSGRKLINAFLDCERNDFESLTLLLGSHFFKSLWSVQVRHGTITINQPFNFSLVRLFGKFKRINEVIIKSDNEVFVEQIRGEINLIVEALPRNRSLRVHISGTDSIGAESAPKHLSLSPSLSLFFIFYLALLSSLITVLLLYYVIEGIRND